MLTRRALQEQIERHLDGLLPLEDLSAWAEGALRDEEFEPAYQDQIVAELSVLRDATDPRRFQWEAPDPDGLLGELED